MQLKQRTKLPDEHKEFIRKHYKGKGSDELTKLVNSEFGTNYPVKKIYYFKRNNGLNSGLTGRFEKGSVPVNKGKKQTEYMSEEAIANSIKTRFKKGHRPANSKPVGTERINKKDGYIYVKTKNPSTWRPKHHLVWEKHNGAIPTGHMIVFLNQNRRDCSIDNLAMVKKRLAPTLSKNRLYSTHKEITESGILIGELIQKTKRKGKNEKI